MNYPYLFHGCDVRPRNSSYCGPHARRSHSHCGAHGRKSHSLCGAHACSPHPLDSAHTCNSHPFYGAHTCSSHPISGAFPSRSSFDHDVVNNEKEFRVSVDLPGVNVGDISLTANDGTICVRAFRRYAASDGSTTKKRRIEKSFAVPDPSTAELPKAKANLEGGVLVVTVPRKAKPEPVAIDITGDPAAEEASDEKEDPSDDESHNEKKIK